MAKTSKSPIRCAIYTRKSTQEGLEQEFNSLDAQRESGEAYVRSQKHENWILLPKHYNDGGFSGGSMDRPALHALIADIERGMVDVVVVYKVDRLSRSLHDFAKLVEIFDKHNVSFVSVTQQFSTTSSMGRLTLNILLSFAQFEREVISERVRDKYAASRKKGMWMGGTPPLGYDAVDKKLQVNSEEADTVRLIFNEYIKSKSTLELIRKLKSLGIKTKSWTSAKTGKRREGKFFNKGALYQFLHCRTYIGEAVHKDKNYPGLHEAIISNELFENVRAKLAHKNSRNQCNRQPAHGVLQGLIFDKDGRAFSPVCHVRDSKRRYYYYVSQKRIRDGSDEAAGIPNLRVEAVDSLVLKYIDAELPEKWTDRSVAEKREVLGHLLERVTIRDDRIDIILKTEHGPELQSIPVRHSLIGSKKLLLGADGKEVSPQHLDINDALIKALVRAYKWEKALSSGKEKSLGTISKSEKLEMKYVTRIYRLNFLSPKIKEAILDGAQPQSLSLSRLMEDFPLQWHEQEALYGF